MLSVGPLPVAVSLALAALSFISFNYQKPDILLTAGTISEAALAHKTLKDWDLTKHSKDARLSDQIQQWSSTSATHPIVGEQLVGHPRALKDKIHIAVEQLRLADFLSGVDPTQTENQVLALYKKMDPSDTTNWKHKIEFTATKAKSKKQQLKQISSFKRMLEDELTTTPEADSASSKKLRQSLRELLQRRKQLRAAVRASEDHVLAQGRAGAVWSPRVRPSQDADIIRRLARPADRRASYAAWLRQQQLRAANPAAPSRAAAPPSRDAAALRPHISAGGALVWKGAAERPPVAGKAARMQSLAGRDPLLEPGGTGSESWQALKQRADHKVARWMGAGYYPVFG